jgi:hypothetical protein
MIGWRNKASGAEFFFDKIWDVTLSDYFAHRRKRKGELWGKKYDIVFWVLMVLFLSITYHIQQHKYI